MVWCRVVRRLKEEKRSLSSLVGLCGVRFLHETAFTIACEILVVLMARELLFLCLVEG